MIGNFSSRLEDDPEMTRTFSAPHIPPIQPLQSIWAFDKKPSRMSRQSSLEDLAVLDKCPPQFNGEFLLDADSNFEAIRSSKVDDQRSFLRRDSGLESRFDDALKEPWLRDSQYNVRRNNGYPSDFNLRPATSSSFSSPDVTHMMDESIPNIANMSLDDSHLSAIEPLNDLANSGMCRYFMQGYCSRAEKCHFSHVLDLQTTLPNQAAFALMNANPMMTGINPLALAAVYQQQMMNMLYSNNNGRSNMNMLPMNQQLALKAYSNQIQLNQMNLARKKSLPVDEVNRFLNIPLEDLIGQLHTVSKDQHGCRYLQRKLEDGDATQGALIFGEILPHFAELMTDPFGNYLCQKLFEHSQEEQKAQILKVISPDLMDLALNLHGTRALQKLIDVMGSDEQIAYLISSLSPHVVTLIKDLNGNHVIQKCLYRLAPEHNQFIYDSVAKSCIDVATHRHGCCVLQRCIDHASAFQKSQLVQVVTDHALALVQDPFGNYVVQYVLDLGTPEFSSALIQSFIGHVCTLSVQKFSSNVIEKCIRVSDPSIRFSLIEELLNKEKLERLLRDSYANYVIQTTLDFADPQQRQRLVENIRPILPMIRHTPYGKRIQSKLTSRGPPFLGHRTLSSPSVLGLTGQYPNEYFNPDRKEYPFNGY